MPVPAGFNAAPGFAASALASTLRELGVANPPDTPPAGEAAAQALLASLLGGRALGYRQQLSSPLTAPTGCSRLSAHLAFGTLSMRSVHRATEATIRSDWHNFTRTAAGLRPGDGTELGAIARDPRAALLGAPARWTTGRAGCSDRAAGPSPTGPSRVGAR